VTVDLEFVACAEEEPVGLNARWKESESLNLVDTQSTVMQVYKGEGSDEERERERERKRESVKAREWIGGNSVCWWRRFRVAKGGQRVEAAEGERRTG